MALYTISDLHLPLGVNKPMDIFGRTWANYVSRLEENWQNIVGEEDTVVLGGDFSWATYIEQAEADFDFLHRLNGKKILIKGNHDYWWTTMSKLNQYVKARGYDDIGFLHNNYFMYNNKAICGSRGWGIPQLAHSEEDKRIYARELGRIEASINAAKTENPDEIIMFLHYPPLLRDYRYTPMTELLRKCGVQRCYYGHIHKNGAENAVAGEWRGVYYTLCACDHLGFLPILVEN